MLDVFNDTGENYIFQILELEHDKETPKTTITWASKPGRFYSIEFSNDLKIWSEIEGSIVSGGEKTSFVDEQELGNKSSQAQNYWLNKRPNHPYCIHQKAVMYIDEKHEYSVKT